MENENKDRQLVERLAETSLREQRARRRWGVFFRILFFGYIFTLTALVYTSDTNDFSYDENHAAVVDIEGVIEAGGNVNAKDVNAALREAFANETAQGIILNINSPGGSPVEANRIYRELRRLRQKYPDKKVYAVVGDICASGGYYIAAGSDEIYVDENSIVGSIGVISANFGFVEAIEKLGVERRVQTAGKSKNLLDPFLPVNVNDEAVLGRILDNVHENFITAVRDGREERLSQHPDIFSGAIFSGGRSIELGLADGIGDLGYVARDVIGVENIVYYSSGIDVIDDLIKRLGIEIRTVVKSSLTSLTLY